MIKWSEHILNPDGTPAITTADVKPAQLYVYSVKNFSDNHTQLGELHTLMYHIVDENIYNLLYKINVYRIDKNNKVKINEEPFNDLEQAKTYVKLYERKKKIEKILKD